MKVRLKKPTHFARGKTYPACLIPGSLQMTHDRARVTCKNCLRTVFYKKGAK